MTPKNKKRTLIMALSLMITLVSCGSKENYRNNLITKSKYLAKVYDTKELSEDVYLSFLKETTDKFYKNYLTNYVTYMNEEQCKEMQTLMEESYEFEEMFPYDNTFTHLDNIMGVEEGEYGRGILRAFNTRLVYENILSAWYFQNGVYEEINTLRMLVSNDKIFFSSLFSKDMDKFIDCLMEKTGFESREEIEELILKFDYYSDIIEKTDYSEMIPKEEYNDEELKAAYEKRIKKIMGDLVEAKLKTDENFAKTLYGKILSNSEYVGPYKYNITNDLFNDTASIWGINEDYASSYSFSIPSKYLYMNMGINEIKEIKVCDIIDKGSDKNNDYENTVMRLIIHLIDPLTLNNFELSSKEIRQILYNNLTDEFKTIEDFDTFFLSIVTGDPNIYYGYFTILEHRIKKDGITYDDFVRFTSLANFITENEKVFIDWDWNIEYPPYDVIEKMNEEEYNEIVSSSLNSDIFNGTDKMCMGMVYDLIKENDLGFEQLYNQNLQYTYQDGIVYFSDSNSSILSAEIYPVIGSFSGKKVIYYEIPENYENGKAVESFYNIERKLTTREVEGIKETFYDEISDKTVNGFIVSFNDELSEDIGPIRFMEYYIYFDKKQEKKKLTLGGE